ncbi:MAG: hypothetical protein ACI9AR_000119 [Flavobacteriaceae bacterium]|jgi:hypothetical protein
MHKEQIKSFVFYFLCIGILVFLGVMAVYGLEKGDEFLVQDIKKEEVESDPLPDIQIEEEEEISPDTKQDEVKSEVVPSTEHNALITELDKLIDDKVVMKVGSRGTRVGTVQKFLNVFEGKDARIDNDFGNGTKASIVAFQKSAGITSDGEPGPGTYQEMIDWLQKN